MKIALEISFDGTNYHGWQKQNNAISIQQVLTDAWRRLTLEDANIVGCSRTDAGVHARSYVCSLDTQTKIPTDKIHLGLNTELPPDIRALSARRTEDDFSARFSAKGKTYEYKAYLSEVENPLLIRYAYNFRYNTDIEKMRRAAQDLVGTHDFTAFMAAGSSHKTTVRTIKNLEVLADGTDITIRITADAYLYNMVRIISGTLLYVGAGKIAADDMPRILAEKERKNAGMTAPAQGLYLVKVFY